MKLGYVTHPLEEEGKDEIAKLSLVQYAQEKNPLPIMVLTWRRKPGEDFKSPKIDSVNFTLHNLEVAGSVCKAISNLKKKDEKSIRDPLNLIKKLQDQNGRQFVWDPRENKFILTSRLKNTDEDSYTWKDENGEIIEAVTADSEEAAKRKIISRLNSLGRFEEIATFAISPEVEKLKAIEGEAPIVHSVKVYKRRSAK